mgnify:CR=1 FL=1
MLMEAHGLGCEYVAVLEAGGGGAGLNPGGGLPHQTAAGGPLGVLAAMALWHGAASIGVRAGAVPKWDLERAFEGRCARCGYDLSGLAGGVCPECGPERAA